MKELFLEVGSGGLGGGALRRRQADIARRRCLHLTVGHRRKLYPIRVRIVGGAEATSEESAEAQISEGEAERIGREPIEIRRGLVKQSIPGIQGQAQIGVAKAGEQRPG